MKYLELAAAIAIRSIVRSNEKHFLFGCVAIRQDGTIVTSTNSRCKERELSCHAEYKVLRKAGHGAILWVARVDREFNWRIAKPCPGCMSLIKNRKVKKVVYTISKNEYGTINF